MKKYLLVLFCAFSLSAVLFSQPRSFVHFDLEEQELYAMTKQVSQFFSRFNHEEDQFGNKYHPDNPEFRNNEKRRQILPLLFDKENHRTSSVLRDFFITDLTNEENPFYLEFGNGLWYAELAAKFMHEGREVDVLLFLMVEKENLGSKWVLTNVYYPGFSRMFPKGELAEREKHFLHPMSHELDFMNIHKAFAHAQQISYYAYQDFSPEQLSLFLYEVKKRRMQFKTIDRLKFHVFQVPDWYFELSYFNRSGMNSGWLISNLMYMSEEEKQEMIKLYEP